MDRSHFFLQPSWKKCKPTLLCCIEGILLVVATLLEDHIDFSSFVGTFLLLRPKGMELVPWVGGPSVLAKVEEKQQQVLSTSSGSDSPLM